MFHRKLRQMHADTSREMISIEDRYFSLNRVLLLIVGLWPFQKSKLARLQFICFFSILITFIIFQFQRIYNNLEDINEIAIIEKYGRNARYYTATLTILCICCIFVPMSAPIWPDILQIISSTNTSRPRQLQVSSEYFVDQEKYFYYLLLHINAAVCIGCTSAVATGTMLIAYFQYMCAMFTIASYRIQNAIKIQISQDIIVRNKKLAHSRIKSAVDIHRKAMELCIYLISKFEISFFFLIIFGVMTLSLNIFRIFQIASSTCNADELSISFIIGSISLLYMFVANLVGQEITDHSNYIYIAAYKIRWYIAPPNIQKLLLILIQRGNKTFGLNIGGLFIASIQCFATLANTSLSYFTVMYSVRQ
ncbi:odorant receptor 30a-like isoform X5 [Polyergus mexicanus]|uniref:odorant receptor 30a-like isoform X5 n=1 Tax=Polyergus mexicanus TaxID=615972 RepID=UPI0038B49242